MAGTFFVVFSCILLTFSITHGAQVSLEFVDYSTYWQFQFSDTNSDAYKDTANFYSSNVSSVLL